MLATRADVVSVERIEIPLTEERTRPPFSIDKNSPHQLPDTNAGPDAHGQNRPRWLTRPAAPLLINRHRLSWDGRIRTIGLSALVTQLAPPLQRSTGFFHSRVACVRAMDFLARNSATPCEG